MAQALLHTPTRSKVPPALLSRHRCFVLFVYLLLALILYPYVKEGGFGDFVFRVIGGFGILLTVYAISLRRTLLILGILLAIPAVLQRVLLFPANAGFFPCSPSLSASPLTPSSS